MLASPGGATSRGGISSEMTLHPVTIRELSTVEPTVAAYAERMGLDLGSAEGRAELQRAKRLAGVARPTAPQSVTVTRRRSSDKNSFGVKRARRNDSQPTRYFGGVSYAPYADVGEVRMTSMSDAAVRDNLWRLGV